jgi:hypothetical protein
VDALICVNSDANAASDTNIGLANATHATDADSIAEHLFIHLDGGSSTSTPSPDGTTTVAATDTTVDYTAGTPFLAQWDLSNTDRHPALHRRRQRPAVHVFKLDAPHGAAQAAGPQREERHRHGRQRLGAVAGGAARKSNPPTRGPVSAGPRMSLSSEGSG